MKPASSLDSGFQAMRTSYRREWAARVGLSSCLCSTAGLWCYLEASYGNKVVLHWTLRRQKLGKAEVSIMQNPETEVPVSPGNGRDGELSCWSWGQGIKRRVTFSANVAWARWYTANVDMSLHAITSITHGKGAKSRLEFSETLSVWVRRRVQHAGLLQREVGSKVSAPLCRMHDTICLPILYILIASFLWCLGEGVVTGTCCRLYSFYLSWHLAWYWGCESNRAHALHAGICHAPACVSSNSKELPGVLGLLSPYTATWREACQDVFLGKLDFCAFSSSAQLSVCLNCKTTEKEFLQIPEWENGEMVLDLDKISSCFHSVMGKLVSWTRR